MATTEGNVVLSMLNMQLHLSKQWKSKLPQDIRGRGEVLVVRQVSASQANKTNEKKKVTQEAFVKWENYHRPINHFMV